MCLICIEFDKGRMTTAEARRALGEMVEKVGKTHAAEVEAKLRGAVMRGPVQAAPQDPNAD